MKGWQLKIDELQEGINQDLGPDLRKIQPAHQGLGDQGHYSCPKAVSTEHNLGGIHPICFQGLQEVNGGVQAITGKGIVTVIRKLAVPEQAGNRSTAV